jgi:hypothetical protein
LVRASDVFGPPICVVVRRRPIVEHELTFDTRITIGPDWDFLTRLADVIDFGYIDQATCLYRLHRSSISHTAGDDIRRASLAQCRRNAIGHPGFERCAPAVRLYAFYDLLVNLLAGLPDLQNEAVEWPQWIALPPKGRARILRLMAGQSLLYQLDPRVTSTWYDQARRLHPSDLRNQLLARIHRLDPRLCLWLLRARRGQALGRVSVTAGLGLPRARESDGPVGWC